MTISTFIVIFLCSVRFVYWFRIKYSKVGNPENKFNGRNVRKIDNERAYDVPSQYLVIDKKNNMFENVAARKKDQNMIFKDFASLGEKLVDTEFRKTFEKKIFKKRVKKIK